MANRLQQHHRAAVAALLLCFIVATMLISAGGLLTGRGGDGPGGVVTPVGAGVTRTVSSVAEWDAAVASAGPGDVIRLTSTINSRLVYRGNTDGTGGTNASGTAAEPIVITADPGVWVDPGNHSSGFGAVDVFTVDHVHVVGLNVRNAQFGIRCMQCRGSAGAPVRIAGNTVTSTGHAGINIAGHWSTHVASSHVLVEDNVVSSTGVTASAYGEGVYIGHGSTEWIDETSDVQVIGNDISFTGAEGVDIKPGTRNITVDGNFIHDLAPVHGGAISAHYVNLAPNPNPSELDQVTIRNNRIWNVNLAGVAGSNDWAIWVGHGGVDIIDNVVWGLRDNAASTRAVRVRATQDFGPHPITIQGNTFWTSQGWIAEGTPSGASNVTASGNRGVNASSAEIVAAEADFVGPVPALGSSGNADSGGGPGTAFALAGGGGATTTTAPPTTTTTAAPTTTTTAAPTTTASDELTTSTTVLNTQQTSPSSGPSAEEITTSVVGDEGAEPSSLPTSDSPEPGEIDETDSVNETGSEASTDAESSDPTLDGDAASASALETDGVDEFGLPPAELSRSAAEADPATGLAAESAGEAAGESVAGSAGGTDDPSRSDPTVQPQADGFDTAQGSIDAPAGDAGPGLRRPLTAGAAAIALASAAALHFQRRAAPGRGS